MRGTALLLTMWCLVGPGLACSASTSATPPPADTPTDEVSLASDADAGETPAPDVTPEVIEDQDVTADIGAPVADAVDEPDIEVTDADVDPVDGAVQDIVDGDADASVADAAVDTVDTAETTDGVSDVVEPTAVSLIDNTAWALVAEADDPFVVDGGPAPDLCPESEVQAEDTPDGVWLDVKTEGCAWATLQQPLLVGVSAGDHVRVTVVHFEIYAGDTDYTLSVALGQGAEVIWTETVAVGAGFELIEGVVSPTMDHPAGAPIWYHVSNHGENTWSLVGIDLLVP